MSLKHSILAVLSSEPKTGYELSKDVQGSTGFFWKASHQQIYKELSGLEKIGFIKYTEVAQQDKPDKKIYSVTKSGVKELIRWMREPTELPAMRDAFLIKLFVGHLIERKELVEDLERQKRVVEERQAQFQSIEKKYFEDPSSLPIEQQFTYMTLRKGIIMGNAWLSWCREVENFLK